MREMSILRYFKPKDGLPDPTGALSTSVPSAAIAQANREIQKAVTSSDKQKRGPYTKFNAGLRAEIGKYSSYHGVAAASCHFSQKLSKRVSETTVRSIRSAYLEGVKRKRPVELDGEDEDICRTTSEIAGMASFVGPGAGLAGSNVLEEGEGRGRSCLSQNCDGSCPRNFIKMQSKHAG